MGQVKAAAPAALILILVSAAVLRLLFFTGYHGADDVRYIRAALELSEGGLTSPTSHWAARIGLIGPTALFYRAFGVTPLTTSAFPFLCSLLGVGAAFAFGRRLYGARSGLLAALLLAFLPMDVIFASMLFPTEPVMLLCGVGLGCFLLAERERRSALYLASGFSIGLAAVAHEAALMILVLYPVYVVIARPVRAHLLAAIGFAFGLGLDPLIHGLMGDPWTRITLLMKVGTVQGTAGDVGYRGLNLSWIGEPLARLFVERKFGLFPWLLAPLVALRLWKPLERIDRALALIIAVGFLWLVYGTVSPTSYAPLARLPRYLAPLALPGVWLLGHELAERVDLRARFLALMGLGITSVLCLTIDSGSALPPYQELRAVLTRLQPARVVIEPDHEFGLLFAESFQPSYALSQLDDAEPRNAVVVAVGAAARTRVEGLRGVETLARIAPPETLYRRLLRTDTVIAILRATRPAPRFEEYAKKTEPWSLWVYRVP